MFREQKVLGENVRYASAIRLHEMNSLLPPERKGRPLVFTQEKPVSLQQRADPYRLSIVSPRRLNNHPSGISHYEAIDTFGQYL